MNGADAHHSALHCRGMWIFRGQEIPAIMQEECFDLPLYEWTKVDTNDAVSCMPSALVPATLLITCCVFSSIS